jgi:folate-binding protein YgfZ
MDPAFAQPSPRPVAAVTDSAVFCAAPELALLSFTGRDAEAFLQGQLSNDVAALAPRTAQLSSYNSAKGRMLATIVLWRDDGEAFRALVGRDLAETLRKRLSMYVLRAKVTVADVTHVHALLGVGGAGAQDAVRAAFGDAPDRGGVLARDPATLVGLPDGRLIIVAASASAEKLRTTLAEHAAEVSADVWRWLGIRAGVPTIAPATQDLFVLQTANWDLLGGVSFQKGCYTGQEIVARTQYLGRLKERMRLFHVDAPPTPPGTRIYGAVFGDQACGTVVDAAPAPAAGSDLLAILQLTALDGPLHLGSPDGPTLDPLPLPYAIPAPVAPNRPKLQ